MTLLLTNVARAELEQPSAVPVPPLGVMRKALLEDSKPYEVAIGALPTRRPLRNTEMRSAIW